MACADTALMIIKFPNIGDEEQAKLLFFRGYSVAEISRGLDIPYSTVDSWRKRYKWDKAPVVKRVRAEASARLAQLIAKEDKGDKDYREMDELGKVMERMARVEKYQRSGNEADVNPNVKNRQAGRQKAQKKKKEALKSQLIFSDDEIKELEQAFIDQCYPHQLEWWEQSKKYEMRQYLKSRQIGATYTFAIEALMHALKFKKNQIFISASRNQANVFRSNIVAFVERVLGFTLKGEHLKLGAGVELRFLGTNSNTAQSYSGDVYFDEVFWIPNFNKIQKVASGMTTLDDRRVTYFSTPSSTQHEAYPLWTGDAFNVGRSKAEKIHLDVSHAALKDGRLCEDGFFRQVITIDDAIDKGYDLVTLKKLQLKFPPTIFDNLFRCIFVNDMDSVFKTNELMRCMIDSVETWADFHPFDARPLGDTPVWIGYDPSRSQDDASLVVVAPPIANGAPFRVVEKESFTGLDFDKQAAKIKQYTQVYNVQYIGIDSTGIGQAVFDLVQKFYPQVRRIIYNVEQKNQMVLKAKQLISAARIQWDASWYDLTGAFLTIHQAPTGSGRQITYKASRTAESGHADLAWALMHALINDPLGGIEDIGSGRKSKLIEC